MKKNINAKCIIVVLLSVISLLVFSFKEVVYSITDASGIPLESTPRSIEINPDSGMVVIANEKSDSVSIVDLNTHIVHSTILVGKTPRGVAIDKGLNKVVIGNSHDDTISIIDLNTNRVTATISVGRQPEGIATDPSSHIAVIANHLDYTVSVIDLLTHSTIATIPVGKEPIDAAIDNELNLALVVNEEDSTVTIIDLNTYQVTGTVPVGKKPKAIAINAETHIAGVVNEKDNSITTINLLTWQKDTISIGKHPIDIAINSLDNQALVISDEDGSLLLIDLNTNTIIKTYLLNKLPAGVAMNNFTNVAAVADDKTDSLTLIQLPNPVPQIESINPNAIVRGSKSTDIIIEGSKFIKNSIVSFQGIASQTLQVEFIDNHSLRTAISEELLQKSGAYQITVTNPSPAGGKSNSAILNINNPVPSILMLDPAEAMAGKQGLTLSILGTGIFDDTEIYFGDIKKQIAYINNTKLQIDLTPEDLKTSGQYEITARNLSPGGGYSNKLIFTIKNPLEIKIVSPTDGEVINKAKIIVKGSIKSETKDIGIKVNGIIAEITGNEWIVNNVPLTLGSNVITATVTDSFGNTDTKAITINTNDTSQPIQLSANITSGIAPLTTHFSISTSFVPVSYQMDFEGDGVIDHTGTTFDDVSHIYATEGIFYPTLTVADEQGNIYSDTIAITVFSKTEIDTLLRGKWEGMKEELKSGNIGGALSYFIDRSKDRYRSIFEALKDQLPMILATFIEFNIIDVFENIAEYEIVANENGVLYSYPGTLIKRENGIWKFKDF